MSNMCDCFLFDSINGVGMFYQNVTSGNLSSITLKTNDSEFMQKLLPSKKPKLNGDCRDDELTARLTELWERNETTDVLQPSPNILHAGIKRKSRGDISMHARSVILSNAIASQSSAEAKQLNGILSQMLLNNSVTTSVSTPLSLSSVATATPQMSMAKSIANMLGRNSNDIIRSNSVNSSVVQTQKQNDLLVSQLKFLSGGTSRTEARPSLGSKVTIAGYPAVIQNSSSAQSSDSLCPMVFDDDDVLKFLVPDTPSSSTGLNSGSDDAFLQQLEQILSEATESDIDSVLNDGVIAPPSALPSANATWLTNTANAATSPNVSLVPTSAAAAEQRAICKIQSQLMRETANIQPVPQQQKLLGLLLSEGSRSCSAEARTVEKESTSILQNSRPSTSSSVSSQSQSNYRLLNPSGK